MVEFAQSAAKRGLQVIIAGAGGAAHLPGMVASLTDLPVVGVPVRASNLEGLDSLLSIVQMPRGVPVATVAINNARNAGLLAARILGVHDPEVQRKVAAYRESASEEVAEKARALEEAGFANYLSEMEEA
jgi:5-(carboxyamino)imidazole ribonucleotide mutase